MESPKTELQVRGFSIVARLSCGRSHRGGNPESSPSGTPEPLLARRFILDTHSIVERGLIMQVLENWHPQGITVYMDDKRFLNCVLTECKLVYGGGDVTWENTQFVNCQLTFDGAAQRTVAYLQNFRPDAPARKTGAYGRGELGSELAVSVQLSAISNPVGALLFRAYPAKPVARIPQFGA